MAITEIKKKITPLLQRVEKDYRPQDVATALLGLAFEILLKADPDRKRTFNVFRALADNVGRLKVKPQKV